MSEHPDASTLDAFLRNALPDHEGEAILDHLDGGCDRCSLALAERACGEAATDLSAEQEKSYDAVLETAFDFLRERARDLASERKSAEKLRNMLENRRGLIGLPADLTTWSACEVLLERSFALRHDDPAGMVRLARWAVVVAEGLDPGFYGRYALADLRARAWAELANACRVADNLAEAESVIERAWEVLPEGTEDRELRARVTELAASIHCSRRRYEEGFKLLDTAHKLYLRSGDQHSAGRALISKGLYSQYRGELAEAERLLGAGLALIDRGRDRRLLLHGIHNYLLIIVDLGEFQYARECLPHLRVLHHLHGAGRLDAARLLWLEGRVAAGLGELESAGEKLQEVRVAMEKAELGFASALAGLDLAAVWLRQGRTAEMRALVDEAVATFLALKVKREALGGLRMLQEAARQDRATLELFETVIDVLRKAEHDPRPGGGSA